MADVFISYSRADQVIARRVAQALQAAGFKVWWDADLPAHRSYSEVIERNLADAKAVVVLWSKAAAQSQWVRAEADIARNAGKLVQANIDVTTPPLPFNQIQSADLTGWRGGSKHAGWAKLQASVESLVSGEETPVSGAPLPTSWQRVHTYRWWAAAALALVAVAAALILFLSRPADERKPVLAVLPFKSLDARDASLAAGMWEDTRQAIGRNRQLVVLGPNTAQQLARKGEQVSRRAADYVLEASLRSAGGRIRVSTELIRTKDRSQVWSEDFDRKLEDVFAIQSEIASEIEGRIRGRLAEGGGRTPEHISTSGEVYALYNDARVKLRKRDILGGYTPAVEELREVVRMDPNFAPGWATLAVAERLAPPSDEGFVFGKDAEGHARRAIALAPNLGAAHAALAFTLNLTGPLAEVEILRAVELDPNDPEALNWLGAIYASQNRTKQAMAAWSRAVEIEPLWWPPNLNKVRLLLAGGDERAAHAELNRLEKLGSGQLSVAIRMEIAIRRGDLSSALNIGLKYLQTAREDERTVVALPVSMLLLQLGYDDVAWKFSPAPPFARLMRKNDPRGLVGVEAMHLSPIEFFSTPPLQNVAGRVLVVNGRGNELAQKYDALGFTPDQLQSMMGPDGFVLLAPILAKALQGSGDIEEARRILERGKAAASSMPTSTPDRPAALARIYAVEGRKNDALRELTSAVERHWFPTAPELLNDIALDPAFASLRSDSRFEQLRQRILQNIERERAQVDQRLIDQLSTA